MTPDLIVTLSAVFMFIALVSGWGVSAVLSARAPERRRLQQLATAGGPELALGTLSLVDNIDPRLKRIPGLLPKSPKEMNRLRRRLATAGYHSTESMVVYGVASILSPIVFALLTWAIFGTRAFLAVGFAAAVGWLLPGLVLARLIERRKKQIQNGLPDALDLLIVCVEAGCALDQAIVKASDELEITYPALTEELRMITTEVRAGKPRLEAFKNFAARTKVEDVQSLVALLVQTDKFGTSIAQALRTHAETSRTKRRQRAEERAAKVGVKLVFPLVLFLFPALYVVILGPAVIQFINVFHNNVGR
jgi:tight adherence protein C